MSLLRNGRRVLAIALLTVALVTTLPSRAAAQFVGELDWRTLAQINARDGTNLAAYDLNTPESKIRMIGAFSGNYIQGWYVAIDSGRSLAYLPELEFGPYHPGNVGGTIAVIDLKTMTVARRMVIETEGFVVTPAHLAIDTVANRLFVSDWHSATLFIVDAATGDVLNVRPFEYPTVAHPYSSATNRLYTTSSELGHAALNLADLEERLVPLAPLPVSFIRDYSYIVLNDDQKLAYLATVPENVVFAYDIDPLSPTFHQIVWQAAGGETHPRSYLQPALDRMRRRLYVPDVINSVIRVFDTTSLPHQELAPISLQGYLPNDPEAIKSVLIPEVDAVTGLVYAALITDTQGATLLVIDPSQGVVGRVTLPARIGIGGSGVVWVDPGSRRVFVSSGDAGTEFVVLDDLRSSTLATGTGAGAVTVSANEASITFASVTQPGTTEIRPVTLTEINAQLPGQFTIDGSLPYEVTSTAVFTGPITLCFSAAHINDPAAFEALHVLHGENGVFVDRTISRDYPTRTICATTSSLSPFVVARRTSAAYSPKLLYTVDRSFKRGSTVPLKVQIIGWDGTNISAPSRSLKALSLKRSSDDTAIDVEDSGQSNPDDNFRYDADLQGYIFNLRTKGLTAGTYVLTADVGGQAQYVQMPFSIR